MFRMYMGRKRRAKPFQRFCYAGKKDYGEEQESSRME
jgi:hypothetical protein